MLKFFDYVVKSTKTPRQQKKNNKKNPILEQVNNEKISEIQNKLDDSYNVADKAAFAALGNASSSTTISRLLNTGMENKIL
jgi:hypothetical protein